MKYPKIHLAQTIIQLFKAKGIKHIVLSPGSRNAPLTIGFTHDDFFTCYSVVDERCAGFFALGIAQQIKQPVAVVCTSGSALLNYFPAVAEAFYSNIPLIVLSADRPKHLIGIGDGQTINQKGVYGTHITYGAYLKEDSLDEEIQQKIQNFNQEEVEKAINSAYLDKLPVHINSPFNEPLYDTTNVLEVNIQTTSIAVTNSELVNFEAFTSLWNSSPRKMVLVGVLEPNSIEQKYVDMLLEDESVLLLTETTSNLHHSKSIPSIDKLIAALSEEEFSQLQPDVLLTFGGLVVSKKIKQFLRKFQPKAHYHVGLHRANDTFFKLTEVFKYPLNSFFNSWSLGYIKTPSDYQSFWLNEMSSRRIKHDAYIKQLPYTDFKVFNTILNAIPNNYQVQVGNSSVIRYMQLFDVNKTLTIFCNRGTSGIDGTTSTAIGASITHDNPTLCITGDLSFFYDSNALWNNYIPKNFKIIVINNSGGGIFRILPGDKNTENFDRYFETKHELKANKLAEMYGFNYLSVSNEGDLEISLEQFFRENNQPQLLEVITPSRENDKWLLDYFKAIK